MSDTLYLDELTLCASYYLLSGVQQIDEQQLENLAGIWDLEAIESNTEAIAELLTAFNQYVEQELGDREREKIRNAFQAGANYLDLALEHYEQEQVGETFSAQLVTLIQTVDVQSREIENVCMDWQRPTRRRFRNRG